MKKLISSLLVSLALVGGISFQTEATVHHGWLYSKGHWNYYSASGQLSKGWVKTGNSWYYLDNQGVMKTGWASVGGKWYFLNSNGSMKTGWVLDSGKWYFLSQNGDMMTGWVKSNNHWYYLNKSGAMLTGWQTINGKTYYFYPSGEMAHNTVISGKTIGADGATVTTDKTPLLSRTDAIKILEKGKGRNLSGVGTSNAYFEFDNDYGWMAQVTVSTKNVTEVAVEPPNYYPYLNNIHNKQISEQAIKVVCDSIFGENTAESTELYNTIIQSINTPEKPFDKQVNIGGHTFKYGRDVDFIMTLVN